MLGDDGKLAIKEAIPPQSTILGWITDVVRRGDRRPGTLADTETEQWIATQFELFGLRDVHREPVQVDAWHPGPATVEVLDRTGAVVATLAGFPLPHTTPGTVEADLADVGPDRLEGCIAVLDYPLPDLPQALIRDVATATYDPDDDFSTYQQRLPFGAESQKVADPIIDAGAVGFIGLLTAGWWQTSGYYLPYDGERRDLPALWLAPREAAALAAARASGGTRVRVTTQSERHRFVSHNVVGVLQGSSDEWIIVGTHHDGPFLGAVEDASGVAMVLAQAQAWATVPLDERPHNLMFVAMAAHLTHGAGTRAFIAEHADLLDATVLEIHLEHIAAATTVAGDQLVVTADPEPRWWFTSQDPWLEKTVEAAIVANDLRRSFVLRPDIFSPIPPTDGGFFHEHRVPLVNLLAAPCYLFVPEDTLDKVHAPSLVPTAQAVASIIAATAGQTAASMRGRVR